MNIRNIIPAEFIENAYDLNTIGFNELAWDYYEVIEVLKYLKDRNYIILGGDVYKKLDDGLHITADSWFCNMFEPREQCVNISYTKSIDYISKYFLRNGSEYVYSIVIEQSL